MKHALLAPKILRTCSPSAAERLRRFHALAYEYALAARLFSSRLGQVSEKVRLRLWHEARPVTAADWFGPYSAEAFATVSRVVDQLVTRFERGYEGAGPVRLLCLAPDQERCSQGVLANAREFGVVRVCPRLVAKNAPDGVVVLHELLHQGLGVEDVRHAVCRRGSEVRCYRGGALRLAAAGHHAQALRNNDNFAYFAQRAHAALLVQVDKENGHERARATRHQAV